MVTDGVGGGWDDEEKGRSEKRVRNERLGVEAKALCEKGWRLWVSCSLMAGFFRCEGGV